MVKLFIAHQLTVTAYQGSDLIWIIAWTSSTPRRVHLHLLPGYKFSNYQLLIAILHSTSTNENVLFTILPTTANDTVILVSWFQYLQSKLCIRCAKELQTFLTIHIWTIMRKIKELNWFNILLQGFRTEIRQIPWIIYWSTWRPILHCKHSQRWYRKKRIEIWKTCGFLFRNTETSK